VTAARTPDGRLAVIYLPTQRTISVDRSAMAAGTRAAWIDPTSGRRRPVPMSASFTAPGRNAAGGDDWLLVLTG
jgi:collagenase-like protein with putative collagen-binding domain